MTNIAGRSATALLVIDVQIGVVEHAYERAERIERMAGLVRDARAHGIDVIWVQHSDDEMPRESDAWQIVPELVPLPHEHIVHKHFRSSFEGTDLEELLAARHIGHLIVCGAQTEFCVRNTVHAAYERGYDVTLVQDAHTTNDIRWNGYELDAKDIIDGQNLVCWGYDLPGRTCTISTAENAFASVTL